MNPVKHIHLIGIGGAGMSGIAEVLIHQGYQVTGSDLHENDLVKHLAGLGAKIFLEHRAENMMGADVIVVSTAISTENPEWIAAKKANIPIIPRAQMLADLMRAKHGIAIAGTHGKTTTTSLMVSVLTEAGLDPTFVIGGLLKSSGTHAYLGKSHFFVAEADESDASFLHLYPEFSIVTNIDADHMSTYGNDFNQLKQAFLQFLHRLPFHGLAVVCLDDPVIQEILPAIARPTLTYGFHAQADLRITNYQALGFQSQFTLKQAKKNREIFITLNLPGEHNALNTAAVCAIAMSLGVSDIDIQTALEKFAGVGRRMQIYGELSPVFLTAQKVEKRRVLLIDDYGHHPREIVATWSAIRQAWPERRLVVVYQPHRYSRTHDLFSDFVKALSQHVDQLILLDIYAAGEDPRPEINGEILCEAVEKKSKNRPIFVPNIEDLPNMLSHVLADGDILLTQGAGNVGAIASKLAAEWMMATPINTALT